MDSSERPDATEQHADGFDRRSVLKLIGGTTVTVGAMSGTASAHSSKFLGCSQVCSDTQGDFAVVSIGGGFECRPIDEQSNRNDVPWSHDNTYCYESDPGEAVVGILEEDEYQGDYAGEGCTLCLNPNRCASNHYDSVQAIVDDLDDDPNCGACQGEIDRDGDCDTYGTGKGRGNGGDKGDENGGNGRGNGGNGKGNGDKGSR
jgi:hypothetical protein